MERQGEQRGLGGGAGKAFVAGALKRQRPQIALGQQAIFAPGHPEFFALAAAYPAGAG
jgi:hypothetical protein